MALIWTWHYHSLDVWEESDDEWMAMFFAYDENGGCSPEGVEVSGTYYSSADVRNMPEYQALETKRNRQFDTDALRWRSAIKVQVRHPESDRWALVASVDSDKLQAAVAKWEALVGADRVRVVAP